MGLDLTDVYPQAYYRDCRFSKCRFTCPGADATICAKPSSELQSRACCFHAFHRTGKFRGSAPPPRREHLDTSTASARQSQNQA
ncbi:hypothetical protein TGRH88_081790 [Toxoplasma gondii]|uniref:Uncharacterized protein n=1 Tax=Toxoplasma gondii TaxID=5811 RepID=A0A7J6K5Z1_TOXGO|nr:hypothetical protein TGRH88_081790 [Toxoplasma gondii]